jgi:hypothetical protein
LRIPTRPAWVGAAALFAIEEGTTMLANVLMLAQENAVLNLRNGLMLLGIIALIVGYKVYKNKTMG